MPKRHSAPFAFLALAVPLALVAGCSEAASDRVETTAAAPKSPAGSGGDPGSPANAPTPAEPVSDGKASEGRYQIAPDFDLVNVAEGNLKLSDLSGKVVLLDFWATWCGPCRAGIPHLNELYAQNQEKGLEIIGISVDRGRRNLSGIEMVRAFLQKVRMDYPIVMADARTVSAYGGIRSIPTAFLIDRQGRLRKRYVGLQHKSVFERDVAELLAEGESI